jgi:type I restriction enzyme S subunit
MSKAEYKRLGDYIREVNVRNRELLKVTKLVGLTIDKAFIPSVANVIGTDLSNYKVIRKEQFACSLMQVSRDGKMPVAMFEEDEAIMSPAYPMFEVIDKTTLMPQYLMMWFSRSEFDREASYYAVGCVRGSLTWEDFCNMRLPIPSITRQREIVAEYETLSNRIHLNNQMIQHLEASAQALYRKTFVDNIDKENLPKGWRMGKIEEFCIIMTGKKDVNESLNEGKYRFFSCSPDLFYSNEYIAKGPAVLVAGNGSYTGRVTYYDKEFDLYQRTYACIPKEFALELMPFFYCVLKFEFQGKFLGGSRGSSIPYIVRGDIADFEFVYNQDSIILFSVEVGKILSHIQLILKENDKLTELQSLLLAKMGQ